MRTLVACLVVLSVAGCVDPLTERLRAGDVEPPRWQVGDWWEYRLTSEVYDTEATIRVVVANTTPTGFVMGVPADADAALPLLQHMPAIGFVRDDLAYDVHERRFSPLAWPLADGLEWETRWIDATVRLRANLENGTWNVTNAGHEDAADGIRYAIVYDPAARWLTSFTRTGADGRVRASVELVANGTGHVGELRAPGNIQVALLQSRTAGSTTGGSPAAPNPSFTLPATADTVLVGCLAGGAPGQYHAEVRSPTGVVCALDESIPPGDARMRAQVLEVDAQEGAWEARLLAVGPGSAVAEVLAYKTANYTLG